MKYFTIVFFCGFFCLGKFQIASDYDKLLETLLNWHPNEDDRFLKTIQNYPGLFPQRSKLEPCVHIQPERVPPEQPYIKLPTENKKSYYKEPHYKPSITTESAILQPKVLHAETQKKVDPAIFEKNLVKNYDDNFVNADSSLERILDKFNDNNIFVIPPVKQERETEKIQDLKQDTKRLMNSIRAPIEKTVTPANVQCADKIGNTINNPSRRFMESDDNALKTENLSNGAFNTNTSLNILLPKRSTKASNPNDLKISNDINFSEFSKNGISLEPSDSEFPISESETLSNRRDDKLNDPAQGNDISNIKRTKLMLINYDKVCYACSSANNPTCLSPDRRTTVKYCRKGVDACVTKTFKAGDSITVIRDCGKSCDDFAVHGLGVKYRSCSICHTDLCNSAYSNNIHSLMFTIPFVISLVLVAIQVEF